MLCRFLFPSRGLAAEDLVVHENFASVQLDGNFPRFLDILHRQRVRKCKGDCDKRWSRSVHVPRGDAGKPLTESKEGEDSDGKGEILHAETVKIKPGKLKQWVRGLWKMGGETGRGSHPSKLQVYMGRAQGARHERDREFYRRIPPLP